MITPQLTGELIPFPEENYNVPLELIYWWTTTIYCPRTYKQLKGLSYDEFREKWNEVSLEDKKNILHFSMRRWYSLRDMALHDAIVRTDTDHEIEKAILQNVLANTPPSDAKPGDPTFVYGLFNNTADERDYHPDVWKIRMEYLEAIERAGGSHCPGCERNAILNKYKEKLDALLGGPTLS